METACMATVLVGGGPDTTRRRDCLQPFVEACLQRDVSRVGLLLAGDADSAELFAPEYTTLLPKLADRINIVALEDGIQSISQFDALVVGGGPTPAYHSALRPVFADIRRMVASGCPYLGFSAGAMIAGDQAVLGGYQTGGVDVCPADWSEGLNEITLRGGLGIVPGVIEVHAAQAGTLGRAIHIVLRQQARIAVALDEDTALHSSADRATEVLGAGRAWWIHANELGQAVVDPVSAGQSVPDQVQRLQHGR